MSVSYKIWYMTSLFQIISIKKRKYSCIRNYVISNKQCTDRLTENMLSILFFSLESIFHFSPTHSVLKNHPKSVGDLKYYITAFIYLVTLLICFSPKIVIYK